MSSTICACLSHWVLDAEVGHRESRKELTVAISSSRLPRVAPRRTWRVACILGRLVYEWMRRHRHVRSLSQHAEAVDL